MGGQVLFQSREKCVCLRKCKRSFGIYGFFVVLLAACFPFPLYFPLVKNKTSLSFGQQRMGVSKVSVHILSVSLCMCVQVCTWRFVCIGVCWHVYVCAGVCVCAALGHCVQWQFVVKMFIS